MQGLIRRWTLSTYVRRILRASGHAVETLDSFRFNHIAFKLNSLWHVGYLVDDFYGLLVCSRANLLLYNPARRPDSIELLRLLGSKPSYILSLLYGITFSPTAILHFPTIVLVSPVQSFHVPSVDFVISCSLPLTYLGVLDKSEHIHYCIVLKYCFEVSSVWRFANCDISGFKLLY